MPERVCRRGRHQSYVCKCRVSVRMYVLRAPTCDVYDRACTCVFPPSEHTYKYITTDIKEGIA